MVLISTLREPYTALIKPYTALIHYLNILRLDHLLLRYEVQL